MIENLFKDFIDILAQIAGSELGACAAGAAICAGAVYLTIYLITDRRVL